MAIGMPVGGVKVTSVSNGDCSPSEAAQLKSANTSLKSAFCWGISSISNVLLSSASHAYPLGPNPKPESHIGCRQMIKLSAFV